MSVILGIASALYLSWCSFCVGRLCLTKELKERYQVARNSKQVITLGKRVDRSTQFILVFIVNDHKYLLMWHPGDDESAIAAVAEWCRDPELSFTEDNGREAVKRILELKK